MNNPNATKSPNDPSSPTAKPEAGNQETEMSRSVQQSVSQNKIINSYLGRPNILNLIQDWVKNKKFPKNVTSL